MKEYTFILISAYFTILIFFASSQNLNIASSSQAYRNEPSPESNEANLIKGWLKFFTFVPDFTNNDMPTKFDYNPAYQEQFSHGRTPDFSIKSQDQFGFFNIPSELSFFFVLSPKTLYVINARRNDIAKTYKSLEINWLFPEEIDTFEQSKYIGGLEDIGNFREGFCFRLRSKTRIIWNICADTLEIKTKWMKAIYSVMEKHEIAVYGTGESLVIAPEIKLPFNMSGGQAPFPESGPIMVSHNGSAIDGRWVILQDWSQCTVACGGGKQYLQRMCVPPQNGGRPCDGETILDKDCNIMPCPSVVQHETEGAANPTMIKMQKLWSRPQRYEVCIIKEGDMDMLFEEGTFSVPPRFPVRVILNNRTFSVFTSPSYDSVYKSFDLHFMKVGINPLDPKMCLSFEDTRDKKKSVGLCIMPTALKRNQSVSDAKEEWINDVEFFRDKCQEKTKFVVENEQTAAKRLMIDLENKEDHYERVREKDEEEKQKEIEDKIESTAHIALEAIEKEIKFEQLAVEEEMMREKDQDLALQRELDDEDYRKHCLEREIKRKAKIKQMEKHTLDMSNRVKLLQQQASLQVQSSRSNLIQRIEAMKRSAERRRRDAKRKMMMIRSSMAESLLKENKIGKVEFCFPNQTIEEREKYCRLNFHIDDPEKENDCLESTFDYCSVCCENEFGSNHEELRSKCYAMCDEEEQNIAANTVCMNVPNSNAVGRNFDGLEGPNSRFPDFARDNMINKNRIGAPHSKDLEEEVDDESFLNNKFRKRDRERESSEDNEREYEESDQEENNQYNKNLLLDQISNDNKNLLENLKKNSQTSQKEIKANLNKNIVSNSRISSSNSRITSKTSRRNSQALNEKRMKYERLQYIKDHSIDPVQIK